jgi:hypothetical protein
MNISQETIDHFKRIEEDRERERAERERIDELAFKAWAAYHQVCPDEEGLRDAFFGLRWAVNEWRRVVRTVVS